MDGNDQVLLKVAVFGLAMSLMCTAMISVMLTDSTRGDYDFDTITGYRSDLVSFSGQSMLNQNPWVLTAVYTPWTSSDVPISDHVDADGWLYGQSISTYSYIGQSAGIKLSPLQKSEAPITYSTNTASYSVQTGYQWWADGWLGEVTRPVADWLGQDTHEHATKSADSWNFTGYRYVFDPTLPFKDTATASSKDGSLSLVWYSYNGTEGLSGGLDIYGGQVKLASYTATDIIAAYDTAGGTATTYDFDFQGVNLTLSIRFDQSVLDNGVNLMTAWTAGDWAMAISSVSAGNFFDIEKSASFSVTAGSMINTFMQIYTFNIPSISNPWMDMVLWLLVGLPMTIAMLCVTLRLVSAVKFI